MNEESTFDLGDEQVTGEHRWTADFSEPSAFQPEVQGGSVEFHDDALEIDSTPGADGVTVWAAREFPEDVIVEYTATCHEDDTDEITGRNFNCFFAATGADGEAGTLAETDRSGDYGEYHGIPNYVFTLTYRHTRMRRDPGFEKRSEFRVGAQPDHSYDVQLLKRGGEIAATLDGRLVHRWTDPDPLGAGWVGLRTWNTHLTYDRWEVYEPTR